MKERKRHTAKLNAFIILKPIVYILREYKLVSKFVYVYSTVIVIYVLFNGIFTKNIRSETIDITYLNLNILNLSFITKIKKNV